MKTESPPETISAVQHLVHPSGEYSIAHSFLALVPYHIAVEVIALPLGNDEKGRLRVAMATPGDHKVLQLL